MAKKAAIKRKTKETDIDLSLGVNKSGAYKIDTQVPFLTHMIEQLSRHSNVDIALKVKGDIQIDAHHITEDTGIVIGKALAKALGDKKGIARFGSACGVLDEALVRVVLDLSGRTYCEVNLDLKEKKTGNFDTELIEEFFHGFARGGNLTLHVDQIKGKNTHHIAEAAFKGLALALKAALKKDGITVKSTKGSL
ncbi:MAG: imidazoleglycerol-phosphate dehydratase HisB [Candidatus Goldiibacteriota bacterium HGW-Goldbacteria-1]|jgi:imidazoleglycerol-phosphate dehydratase|nr:MAG: imidazoleglycerol-phosphate dehydratase HisB [Candidatus Goldiibacteriota bacterium HGW-Goldbacteria-1]